MAHARLSRPFGLPAGMCPDGAGAELPGSTSPRLVENAPVKQLHPCLPAQAHSSGVFERTRATGPLPQRWMCHFIGRSLLKSSEIVLLLNLLHLVPDSLST